MQDFFETLLYIIIGFWVLRIILKWASPYLLKFFIGYVSKKAKGNFNKHQQSPFNNPETNPKPAKKSIKDNKEVGEYIDFEEVD